MNIIAKHTPFKNTGEDFSETNPMFAYYFYKYYISMIKPIYEETKDPSEKAELDPEIKEAFKRMNMLSSLCQMDPSDEVNMRTMLEYTEIMFAKNDHYHRVEGIFTKKIAEEYLTLSRLYEVVKKFWKLDKEPDQRRAYSKKKFIDIMKEIKKNPALQNSKPSEVAQSIKHSNLPPPPPVFKEEKKIEKIEEEIKKSMFKPLPKPSKLISFDKIQMQIEANKCLQNALSELSFDRFKHTRDEVLRVLELLDQLIDN